MSNGGKVSIVHCAETIKGGIATYLRELLPLQRKELGPGEIVVVIPASHQAELPVPDGVRLVLFDDSGSRPRRALTLAWTVAREVRGSDPRVVHVHSTYAGITVRIVLARIKGVRIVYCPHGWAFDRQASRLSRLVAQWIERALLAVTDVVVCISNHERRAAIAQGLERRKLKVVLNGVGRHPPVQSGLPPVWPDGLKRLLFVGRFDHQKGVDLLVKAMDSLASEGHLMLVGGTVLGDRKMDFPPSISRCGWLSAGELERVFSSAEILVIPSRWEGFGLIAAEGMRAGLAIVATRLGGLPEVVENGVTGILVEPESPQAIVEAIRAMDQETIKQMGDAGRRRFSTLFTMDRVHRQLWELYGFGELTVENELTATSEPVVEPRCEREYLNE